MAESACQQMWSPRSTSSNVANVRAALTWSPFRSSNPSWDTESTGPTGRSLSRMEIDQVGVRWQEVLSPAYQLGQPLSDLLQATRATMYGFGRRGHRPRARMNDVVLKRGHLRGTGLCTLREGCGAAPARSEPACALKVEGRGAGDRACTEGAHGHQRRRPHIGPARQHRQGVAVRRAPPGPGIFTTPPWRGRACHPSPTLPGRPAAGPTKNLRRPRQAVRRARWNFQRESPTRKTRTDSRMFSPCRERAGPGVLVGRLPGHPVRLGDRCAGHVRLFVPHTVHAQGDLRSAETSDPFLSCPGEAVRPSDTRGP